MPMLFSPTIGAAITAGYWFLRARCPACRTTGDVDLRTLDWHRGAAVTALTPALSCRSCAGKRLSFRGYAVRGLDLRVELRRLVAVVHAIIANDSDPSVTQLANVRSCDWCPPSGCFGIPPCNEK
jgi:hypothetical protein